MKDKEAWVILAVVLAVLSAMTFFGVRSALSPDPVAPSRVVGVVVAKSTDTSSTPTIISTNPLMFSSTSSTEYILTLRTCTAGVCDLVDVSAPYADWVALEPGNAYAAP